MAEKLLQIASSRGISISVYRPGTIAGHSKTGASNPEQTLGRLLKSFVEQGCAPDLNIQFDFTTVDYISQAIVYLSRQQESMGKNFHLVHPQCLSMRELIDLICSLGYPVKQIDYSQWLEKMEEVILQSSENVLSPILPFLTQKISNSPLTYLEASSFTERLNCDNAIQELAKSTITCQTVNSKLLRIFFSYFKEN